MEFSRGCTIIVKTFKTEAKDHWKTKVLSHANYTMSERWVSWSLKEVCKIVHNNTLDLVTKCFPI